jgi:alpha-glucosidase
VATRAAAVGGSWWREGVAHRLYPRSWADGDGDGVGDLPGMRARLDHLGGARESLGVDAIWLSPFYGSPMVDRGYDVSDYCAVDPMFGTLADFDALLTAAHARGIRVLVDYVPNHTSDQHPWFREARSNRSSRPRDWYVWADAAPGGGLPNNWPSAFAATGRAWTLDASSGQYYLHSYSSAQPDLNWQTQRFARR